MDFSAAEKDSGVKLCVLFRLLSEMSFSHFGELWPRGGWDTFSLLPGCTNRTWEIFCGEARWAVGIGRRIVGYMRLLVEKVALSEVRVDDQQVLPGRILCGGDTPCESSSTGSVALRSRSSRLPIRALRSRLSRHHWTSGQSCEHCATSTRSY